MLKKYWYLACFLSILACDQQDANVDREDIRFGVAQAPINLDPRYATDAASSRVNRLLYRALVRFDAHYQVQPDLASWQIINPDQYRFTLGKTGRTFHDGSSLNASDVQATYQSLLNLKDSPLSAEFSNIKDISVLDENTLDFYLKRPEDSFPSKLVIGILPANKIHLGFDFSHQPIGSGPLKFASWQESLKLTRISDGQKMSLLEIKDPTVRILKLKRGEIDLLQGDLPPELVRYLKKQPELKVIETSGTNFSYIGINTQDLVLSKLLVRRAIAHAINRQDIIQQALVGGSREAGAILPPEHWAGNPYLTSYDYDPILAKALLMQAGVQLPLKLTYKTSTDPQRLRLATIMQAQMREAEIELEIKSLDWGTFFEDVKQGQFQLYGLTWVNVNTPDIYTKAFASSSFPPKGFNRSRFSDAHLDALLAKQDWQGATAYIHQQLPYIPLWYEGQFVAMRKSMMQYQPKPDGDWNDLATIVRSMSFEAH